MSARKTISRLATMGVAFVLALSACSSTDDSPQQASGIDSRRISPAQPGKVVRANTELPSDAVSQYLKARIAGDAGRAFVLLTTREQRRIEDAAALEREWRDESPILSFSLQLSGEIGLSSKGVRQVTTIVHMSAGLDEITGLTPPSATVHWPVVLEAGRWRVDAQRRSVEPRYADESRLIADVRVWAESRRSCSAAVSNEYTGGILHVVGLAHALCEQPAPITLQSLPGTLDDLDDPSPILNAFGGDAANWARVVTITSPVPMRAVAAPVGERWVVTGVFHASPSLR